MMTENYTEDLGNGVELEMISIPGGLFLMGSDDFDDTRPIHRVTLSPFEMSKYPITQAQYEAVMGSNPSHFKGDNLPVESVSWHDAVEFCRRLSRQTGQHWRLPIEAEWEYACLAGSTGKYCFGNNETLLKDYAWYGKNSDSKTHPVGEKLPNNWGLRDMHGNVWEWCQDWYAPYSDDTATGPQVPADGNYRVLRGGSWDYSQVGARAVYRYDYHPAIRDNAFGFRVVLCRPPSGPDTDGALAPDAALTKISDEGRSAVTSNPENLDKYQLPAKDQMEFATKLFVMCAYEAGELSEEQMMKIFEMSRVRVREFREHCVKTGVRLAEMIERLK